MNLSMPSDARTRHELGAFIAEFVWHHWVTLTPSDPSCSPEKLTTAFETRFIRRLEGRAQRGVRWVRGTELSPGGILHIHAVLYGTGSLADTDVGKCWDLGRCQIERYDEARGGAFYLCKDYGTPNTFWERIDLSRKLPPPRKTAVTAEAA